MSKDFLAPIPGESAGGEDLSSTSLIYQLENLVAGTPGTQFSDAQEPDWRAVEKAAAGVLEKSKHLSALVIYAVSLSRLKGLEGVALGLELVSRNVQDYWADLYPRLDPDDDNDPSERLSILCALTAPLGAGDDIKYIERLRKVPIYKSAVLGVVTLEGLEAGDETSQRQFQFALAAEGVEAVAEFKALAERAQGAVEGLSSFLDSTIESSYRRSWANLLGTLKKVVEFFSVSPSLSSDPVEVADNADEASSGGEEHLTQTVSAPRAAARGIEVRAGAISSREDVVRMIDKICEFYQKNEPSSPMPLLLNRAKGLVHKSFLEIMEDISPDGVTQVKNLAGIRD